jgi:hypothetical protein
VAEAAASSPPTEIAEWLEDVLDMVGKLELMALSKMRVVWLDYLLFLYKVLISHVFLRPNSNYWVIAPNGYQ